MTDEPDTSAASEGDPEADEELDEIFIDAPKEGTTMMTFRELEEALADEAHPRHDEAVQRNKELAEQLAPAIESFRKMVAGQQSVIAQSMKGLGGKWMEQLKIDISPALQGMNPRSLGISAMPSVDPSIFASAKIQPPRSPIIDIQRQQHDHVEAIQQALAERERERQTEAQATAERLAREDSLATKGLEVLTSMDANLRVLAERMNQVDTRIKEGNISSDRSSRRMLVVGWATLVATCLGILTSIVIYFLSR